MKLVVEVRDDFAAEHVLRVARKIMEQGSFSHPAHAELQGRGHRLIVDIIGAVDEKYDALVPYIAPPLEA